MLGKSVSKKQANIRKGKGKRKKNKETKNNNVFQKGLMGKMEKKTMEFCKGRQKKRKLNRKKRRILKTGLLGNKI